MSDRIYRFRTRKSGKDNAMRLHLVYEVCGDPMSDDFTPEEEDAETLLRLWARSLATRPGLVPFAPVSWFVEGSRGDRMGLFEGAPFTVPPYADFLTYFTWPTDDRGDPVQWARLPVRDKAWRCARGGLPARADKGGFIQEATGWKPSPLQDRLHWPNLLRASGHTGLVPSNLDGSQVGDRS